MNFLDGRRPTGVESSRGGQLDGPLLCSLEPDLNFVAIRIGDVSVGEAGSELATTEQAPSGAFDLGDGTVDVVGVHEPKAEMRHSPLRPAVAGSSAKVRMSCLPGA